MPSQTNKSFLGYLIVGLTIYIASHIIIGYASGALFPHSVHYPFGKTPSEGISVATVLASGIGAIIVTTFVLAIIVILPSRAENRDAGSWLQIRLAIAVTAGYLVDLILMLSLTMLMLRKDFHGSFLGDIFSSPGTAFFTILAPLAGAALALYIRKGYEASPYKEKISFNSKWWISTVAVTFFLVTFGMAGNTIAPMIAYLIFLAFVIGSYPFFLYRKALTVHYFASGVFFALAAIGVSVVLFFTGLIVAGARGAFY